MSETVILGKRDDMPAIINSQEIVSANANQLKRKVPSYDSVQNGLAEASKLVDDIILKKYLYKLTD